MLYPIKVHKTLMNVVRVIKKCLVGSPPSLSKSNPAACVVSKQQVISRYNTSVSITYANIQYYNVFVYITYFLPLKTDE